MSCGASAKFRLCEGIFRCFLRMKHMKRNHGSKRYGASQRQKRFDYLSMANYRIGRKRRGVTWSNNVTEGNGRLVFKRDLEFAMDTFTLMNPGGTRRPKQISRGGNPRLKATMHNGHTKAPSQY